MEVASISVVVLDPRIAPHDQATWAFTDTDDALAMAGFLNTRVGEGEDIAWVEVVPLARKLNKKALRYLDCWAQLVERVGRAIAMKVRPFIVVVTDAEGVTHDYVFKGQKW
jgi:hypothetical protein